MWDLFRELSFWFLMASPMMAGFKRNSPGCKCCGGCQFFSDDFAVDDLATNYTSVSGSWAISSGNLHTASSSAVLTGNTANPNSDSNTKVSVTVNIANDGDTARIILDYQNSSNYWFAEVLAGSGAYLRIYQRSGGTNTQKETLIITQANASAFSFCASIENGAYLLANVAGNQVQHTDSFTQTGWGLGTGSNSGSVTFDDLTVSKVDATCPTCAYCSLCSNPETTMPLEIEIVTSGTTNAVGGCTNCSSSDGTYIVAGPVEPTKYASGGTCQWWIPISTTACSNILPLGANNTDHILLDLLAGATAGIGFGTGTLHSLAYGWAGPAGPGTPANCTSAVEVSYTASFSAFCVPGTATATVLR